MTGPVEIPAPSRGWLLRRIAAAFIAATVLAVLVVLPAEYRLDPTGFGRLTGLDRLSAPLEVTMAAMLEAPLEIARSSDVPFRTDTVEIQVDGVDGFLSEIEYKITMRAGDTVVYSWTAPSDVTFEFHGHTHPDPETQAIEVVNYRAGTAAESFGTLAAPVDGIHGWYFRNDGVAPVTVELRLSGYYDLAPGLLF